MSESVPTTLPARYRGFTLTLDGEEIKGVPDPGIPLPPGAGRVATAIRVSESDIHPPEYMLALEIKHKLEDVAEAIDAWLDEGLSKVTYVTPGCESWRVVRGDASKDVQTYVIQAPTEEEAWAIGMKIVPRINGEAFKIGGSVAVLTYPTVMPLVSGPYQFFVDVGIQRADGSWYTRQDMLNAFADGDSPPSMWETDGVSENMPLSGPDQKVKRSNLTEATWEEFAKAGFFWWVNRALHLFGWAIVRECESADPDAKVIRVYPARCRFRGFEPDIEKDGFVRLTKHLNENMPNLVRDTLE